ncbi:MAG: 50S ribosomal protein L18 [Deltaproteobacteria bacterium RBG_16_54_11]|nr:MAG: 50S ribosomal protein L18 [Deltaproteobacteria bacterium RBG_16_54_11]
MAAKRLTGRLRRKRRVRQKVQGTEGRPRLTVYRSLNHIYAQVINDRTGQTLAAASTLSKELQGKLKATGNSGAAQAVGELVAQKALERGIKKVVFDRNGFLYHGRIKKLAEAARQKGLEF